jgi:tetratricopeptide (TPR) repeat protein
MSLGRLKKRLVSYRDWIVRWRCMPVDAWLDAAELYQNSNFERAAELYKQGLSSHPTSRARVNALLDLSHCLFRLSRFDEAERYLRQAISTDPTLREGYVRLARLQLWLGYATEAVWTARVSMQRHSPDPELVTLFVTAVVESGGNPTSIAEAQKFLRQLNYDSGGFPRLDVARARLAYLVDKSEEAREDLARMASVDRGPFEAVVAFAEVLIGEGKLAYARHQLHRALSVAADHPKVLRLLARTYLNEGTFYEPEYAVQLALKACQLTSWKGVHELYIAAQSYVAVGDRVAALLAATRAKEVAARLLGGYPEVAQLEKLLQGRPAESQA